MRLTQISPPEIILRYQDLETERAVLLPLRLTRWPIKFFLETAYFKRALFWYATGMAGSASDLHVVALKYTVTANESVSYDNPPPIEFESEHARLRLADGKLICTMKPHFQSAAAARAVVEPILRAWEVDSGLRWGSGGLQFDFAGADIVDRAPRPPGEIAVAVASAFQLTATLGAASVHVGRARYPDPPPHTFRLNPDAESLLLRYQGYIDGREPLLAMAYFCLTVLESKVAAGRARRSRAAKAYEIEKAVLDKMGDLTSNCGGPPDARKATAVRPLTGPEHGWLEAAVKMLIWRLGDTRSGATLPLIRLADLPKL